ncbi:hypothetical protein LTR04_006781, partial [Oleoguttula sp. CCFEE 6159]
MGFRDDGLGSRKRKRRRPDRPPISASLLLDTRIKGEVGFVSEDLFTDLFPGQKPPSVTDENEALHYVAVTPWTPSSLTSIPNSAWTLLPVRPIHNGTAERTSLSLAHSSITFPAASLGLQSFVHTLQSLAPDKAQRLDAPIEIRVSDVAPLPLDTVYVTLDGVALKKHEENIVRFSGGFDTQGSFGAGKGKGAVVNGADKAPRVRDESAESGGLWSDAVRKALSALKILHAGDMLPLPLPTHPITHVPPPPAKITACEPVSQGLVLSSTRIVIVQSHGHHPTKAASRAVSRTVISSVVEEDEDTSNEQFFSAAEDRNSSKTTSPPSEEEEAVALDDQDSGASGTETEELSDDSEDIISLTTPSLAPQSSGILSSFTSATPQAYGSRVNDVKTPGSVQSSFTASTVRVGPFKGRVFRAQGLLRQIPDELLHPKPASDDDDESRVFVGTSTLVKTGCFSGDWVRIEATAEPRAHALDSWGVGAFPDEGGDSHQWRVAKIFGLPESMFTSSHRSAFRRGNRRGSFSMMQAQNLTTPQAYLSPILLANLGGPTHMRISPLCPSGGPRLPAPKKKPLNRMVPPLAKEVTLWKVLTPLSTERMLQPSLFTGLKEHFEQRNRIVKKGDLIGITVDERLGRAVYEGNAGEEEMGSIEILTQSRQDEHTTKALGVAWFRVGDVFTAPDDDHDASGSDIWGGVAALDPTKTRMGQTGNEQSKLPPAMSNTWQYYLGSRGPASAANVATTEFGLAEPPKPHVTQLRRRLRELISVATSPRAVHLGLPPVAILLASTQRNIGKATVATRACSDLGIHAFTIDSYDILTEGGAGGDVKTEAFLKARSDRALTCGAEFTALLIRHVEAFNADRMTTALKEVLADSRVLIATTTEVDKIPDGIRGLFTHELEVSAPDEGEREGVVRGIIEDAGIRLASDVDLSAVAVKTAALVAGDLVDVVDRAIVAKRERLEKLAATATKQRGDVVTVKDIHLAGGPSSASLIKADLDVAVDAARKNFADAIGAPKIPNVSWSDVGGLTHVKDAVMETIQLPLSRPELFAKGMKKRSGILFYGPPGTGKTLLAKAIATEFSLNFFSVKGPELLNIYIGESEANVRRVFQRARDARPCVVFFDELDSVAPKRGNQGDSGGVMDRIVSQLLAELDGMSDGDGGGGGVFVIGATNRPDLLDQALLRPGRFDKMLYLGVSDTHEKQQTILEALTRKFALHPSLSLPRIAASLPFTYTGADLYALCSDAMLKAITRQAEAVDAAIKTLNALPLDAPLKVPASHHLSSSPPDQLSSQTQSPSSLVPQREEQRPLTLRSVPTGRITTAWFFDHLATPADTAVVVTEEDFFAARGELVPSVSVQELQHYDRVRKTFEGDGKDKDTEKEKEEEKEPVSQRSSANGNRRLPPPTTTTQRLGAQSQSKDNAM